MGDETRPLKKKIDGLESRVDALESIVVDVLAVTDRIEPRMLQEQLQSSDDDLTIHTPAAVWTKRVGSSASRKRAGLLDAAGVKRR
jgi:hypothetical protein